MKLANDECHQYVENGFEIKTYTSMTNANYEHSDSSDSEIEVKEKSSPQTNRKQLNRSKNANQSQTNGERVYATNTNVFDPNDDLAYVDTLPEEVKLVEVTSNLWGTKFKIHGLAKTVPSNLGQVTYKTSFLHLQPRQMTLVITELRDDFPMEPDPNFNPNIFSEDEDEHLQSTPISQKRLNVNENAPLIAPMSPKPNRFPSLAKNFQSNKSDKKHALGPLATAELYDDDVQKKDQANDENSNIPLKPMRPKHIETSITSTSKPGPSYSSFVAQYTSSNGRIPSNSGTQSRHAISPLCCEGSVPTLQSPKNAVGPSDTIFERPPAVNYPNNNDYSNVVLSKNSISNEQMKSHAQTIQLNQMLAVNSNVNRDNGKSTKDKFPLKKKDIQFIDEDSTSAQGLQETISTTTAPAVITTIAAISPACINASMTRSCSVGFLDSVEMPSDEALSILRKETPNKRLVLVDRKPQKKTKQTNVDGKKMRLIHYGKSKSLDSCDLKEIPTKGNCIEAANVLPKLCETLENENELSPIHARRAQRKFIETSIMSTMPKPNTELNSSCSTCQNSNKRMQCEHCRKTSNNIHFDQNKTVSNSSSSTKSSNSSFNEITSQISSSSSSSSSKSDQIFSEPIKASTSKDKTRLSSDRKKPLKKNTEVITSYTDSPLFSRKHRFGDEASNSRFSNSESRSPLLCRKFETGISLLKQFSEARKRKKEENVHLIKADSQIDLQQIPSNETKASVALHTQALTTLENIISRLRDLDDSRLTPPNSPKQNRHPKSSPASPALSKKFRRNGNFNKSFFQCFQSN